MAIKQQIYNLTSRFGVKLFTKIFPEYFNKSSEKPDEKYIEYNFALQNIPHPPATILDVGCTSSFFPLILSGIGYNVTGVDIRDYPILNRLWFQGFYFLKRNISYEPLPKETFGAVTAISSIEHFGIYGRYGSKQDDEADFLAVNNIYNCLVKNGVFILTVPVGLHKIHTPYNRVYNWERIKSLTASFALEKEEYYFKDKGDWYRCTKKQAFEVDTTPYIYPIGLYKFIKE